MKLILWHLTENELGGVSTDQSYPLSTHSSVCSLSCALNG